MFSKNFLSKAQLKVIFIDSHYKIIYGPVRREYSFYRVGMLKIYVPFSTREHIQKEVICNMNLNIYK